MTLGDLSFERYWFIEEIDTGEDSEEASKDTTDKLNKLKCSDNKISVRIEQSL